MIGENITDELYQDSLSHSPSGSTPGETPNDTSPVSFAGLLYTSILVDSAEAHSPQTTRIQLTMHEKTAKVVHHFYGYEITWDRIFFVSHGSHVFGIT